MDSRGTDQTPNFSVSRQPNGTYGVESKISGSHRTLLTTFPTEAEAQAWITAYLRRREEERCASG
jgi:hypothetical protein